MPLVLHDNPESSNALKVRLLLEELGLPYARRTVPLARPRPAAYLALNPLGGVPALEDGDLLLAESNAILCYLARRERADDLTGRTPRERARVDELLDRFTATLRPALFRVEQAALGHTPERGWDPARADPAEAERQAEAIAPVLTAFEAALPDAAGLPLGRFTIADCAAAPALWRSVRTGLDLGPYPRLAAWRDALVARPALARAQPVT